MKTSTVLWVVAGVGVWMLFSAGRNGASDGGASPYVEPDSIPEQSETKTEIFAQSKGRPMNQTIDLKAVGYIDPMEVNWLGVGI